VGCRSPLTNVETACQQCHNVSKEDLEARINTIQNRNHELLGLTEAALLDSMDAIIAARQGGATDETLKTAFDLNRRAQMRWDFISSENSMGFHSPQEAARILAAAIDLARQSQMAAVLATPGTQAAAVP
jgi:nitrite reductase (cytochrome c-552)